MLSYETNKKKLNLKQENEKKNYGRAEIDEKRKRSENQ